MLDSGYIYEIQMSVVAILASTISLPILGKPEILFCQHTSQQILGSKDDIVRSPWWLMCQSRKASGTISNTAFTC